jgi:hypothetical protein
MPGATGAAISARSQPSADGVTRTAQSRDT